MKFFFVQPSEKHLWENAGDRVPLGLLYLSAYVKQQGHESRIVDMNHEDLIVEDIIKGIYEPDYICFAVSTPNYLKTIELVKLIKLRHPNIKYVAGGTHITDNPDEPLSLETFDYLLIGEGETAIQQLIDEGEKASKQIFGHYGDVDTYPLPDYKAVDMTKYSMLLEEERCANIVASRGCIYNCLAGDTLINTINGKIPIRELVGKEIGVYSYDLNTRQVMIKKVKDIRLTQSKAEVVRVYFD